MATITAGQTINGLAPGAFKTLVKIKPVGALQVRKQVSGAVSFFWRYSFGASSERVSIGVYDPAATPKSLTPTSRGFSIEAAIRAAEALALEHHQHEGGRPAILAAKREAERIESEARQAAGEEEKRAKSNTLERLLSDYCDHLNALGRPSHRAARTMFRLHVMGAWPDVAALPANTVTPEQVADMMRKLIEAGKGRTANKLRSYMRSAYQMAKAARSKPSIPVAFKAYAVQVNPAGETLPDESANRADKRPLNAQELRTYWQRIKPLSGFKGALLRLHLLSGGQRIEQLVNLRTANVEQDAFTLIDSKGRPGRAPRPHTVPLTLEARKALDECQPQSVFALSNDGGDTHVAASTLSAWAVEIVGNSIEQFQAKRIRSGVETLLASARVSQDIRGRLQSHGIHGVQARHYDGHDYLSEKRAALETLHRMLE